MIKARRSFKYSEDQFLAAQMEKLYWGSPEEFVSRSHLMGAVQMTRHQYRPLFEPRGEGSTFKLDEEEGDTELALAFNESQVSSRETPRSLHD